MYGKVFDTIYDGTLYGHWEAIVTMQQLIVLAKPDGTVDMTPQAIAARTSIPLDIISKGLKVLSEPDPYTRTPGEEGRRIVLVDEHRPWGWRLVNHWKYMAMRDLEAKRKADRERLAAKRKEINDVAIVSQSVADVAHTDTDTDTDTDIKKEKLAGANAPLPPQNGKVLETLPLRDGSEFSVTDSFLAELEPLYPQVDVLPTVKEMKGWLIGNPHKRKTRRGIKSFVVRWLQSEQEKANGV